MTHESFKQIMTWVKEFDTDEKKNFVNEFLDGKNNDVTLEAWFDLWKVGNQREIFDQIKIVNAVYFTDRENDSSTVIPKDFDMTRKEGNKNA